METEDMKVWTYLEIDVMEKVVCNSLIIKNIFKYCPESSFKMLRSVCTLWNEVILSSLNPKLCLVLDGSKFTSYFDASDFQQFCRNMNPKLAKRIKMGQENLDKLRIASGRASVSARDFLASAQTRKLEVLFENFSILVQSIDLCIQIEMIHDLCCLLLVNYCPNLKNISVRTWDGQMLSPIGLHENPKWQWPEKVTPCQRPHLQNINVLMGAGYYDKYEARGYGKYVKSPLATLFQLLIDSAPNLKKLLVTSCFYPDLSSSAKLSTLTVHLYEGESITSLTLHGRQVTKMLNQVANHLETLWITSNSNTAVIIYDYEGDGHYANDELAQYGDGHNADEEMAQFDFRMPPMPKLKYLRNDVWDVFTCGENLQDIDGQKMPSLRFLILGNGYQSVNTLDTLIEGIADKRNLFSSKSGGVTHLRLSELESAQLLTSLTTPFPYLRTLEISGRFGQSDDEGWGEWLELRAKLTACSLLGLKQLILSFNLCPVKLSDFVGILSENCELLRTLQTLQIKNENKKFHGMQDDLDENGVEKLKDVLTAMRGMKRAVFPKILFKETTKIDHVNVLEFIQQNAIQFLSF